MRGYERPPADVNCPYYKKPMKSVCFDCVKWIAVAGTNPNTGETVQGYNCADVWNILIQLEVSQQVRQTGAATESMRNEITKRMDRTQPVEPRLLIGKAS